MVVTHEEEVKLPPEKVKSTSPRVGQEDEKLEVSTPSPSPRVAKHPSLSIRVEEAAGGSRFDSSGPAASAFGSRFDSCGPDAGAFGSP